MYYNYNQNNQILLLSIVELVYNNKKVELTDILLFYTYYRKYLNLFKKSYSSIKAKVAIKIAKEIKKIYKIISKELLRS